MENIICLFISFNWGVNSYVRCLVVYKRNYFLYCYISGVFINNCFRIGGKGGRLFIEKWLRGFFLGKDFGIDVLFWSWECYFVGIMEDCVK